MRFLIDEKSLHDMQNSLELSEDCYVRPGEYPHHLYQHGIRFVVAKALLACLKDAEKNGDEDAILHLELHKKQLDQLLESIRKTGAKSNARYIGDPLPNDAPIPSPTSSFSPKTPETLEDTGLGRGLVYELILRGIYNRGRPTANEISRDLGLPYKVIGPVLQEMRQKDLVDIIGQSGIGEINYEYILKPGRGVQAAEDALRKSEYFGYAPVPFDAFVQSAQEQSIRKIKVTRKNIRQAFSDLIITEPVLNEIGPAINSADSIFLFGYAGNGKTSIAERIIRLMGDEIFIPYTLEADGQLIKLFDPIVHSPSGSEIMDKGLELENPFSGRDEKSSYDRRWIKIKRPTIIVGGELTLPMLDLSYNTHGKFYEAPLQMKACNGIFMIDDFGRQMVRPLDLLNRWIVPLEKKFDFLSTITGNKLQVPFDVLLIFSTNLDPHQLADEAFLRRIKYKLEIKDPDEKQWRQVWELVCRQQDVAIDQKAIDYLLAKWYIPFNRPLRMCHPRDLLNQMRHIATYHMEQVQFSPDLIDAACQSYFISQEEQEFAKTLRMN